MKETRWPRGYRTGFCCDGNCRRCTKGAVCRCECHRVEQLAPPRGTDA